MKARFRVGWDEMTYDVEPDWARMPDGASLGPVTAVAAAADGRVYVCHRSTPAVLIFDAGGSLIGDLDPHVITDPHGITIDDVGKVYITDRDRHIVLVYGPDGRPVRELGTRDSAAAEAPFNHPADVAVSRDGTVYVADGYGNSRVHVFSPDGAYLRGWGGHGRRAGQFRVPHGIAVDAAGNVYVADRENDRVQVFDASGKRLQAWNEFRGPTDVCVDPAGRIFVTDHVPTLTALDTAGRVLLRVRTLHDTHGVCCDRRGRIFVASTAARCVIAYTPIHA